MQLVRNGFAIENTKGQRILWAGYARLRGCTMRVDPVEKEQALTQIMEADALIAELTDVLVAYGDALNASDVDHPNFRDSGADVVELLWQSEGKVRALITRLACAHCGEIPCTDYAAPAVDDARAAHDASCSGTFQPPVLDDSTLWVCDVCSFAIEQDAKGGKRG